MTLDNSVLYFQPVKRNCIKALPHSNCLKEFPNSECDIVTSMTLIRYCIPHTLLRAWFTSGKLKDIIFGYLDIWRKILCYETRAGQVPRGGRSLDGNCSAAGTVCCVVPQTRLTVCDPVDCSPPGSSVRGVLQARTLEWVAFSSSGCDYSFTHLASAAQRTTHSSRTVSPVLAT